MAIQFKTVAADAAEFFVPAGDYNLRVANAEQTTSKSGNDQIKLTLRIIREDGTDGVTVFDYLVFAASSVWKVTHFLKSLGKYPGDDVDLSLDPIDLIGEEVHATLKVEVYEGKKSNKVSAYLYSEF